MNKYSVFEYLYRDAGNFKAWSELLLAGTLSDEEVARIEKKLEAGIGFIAEQVFVPPLYQSLWRKSQSDPSGELDHAWHEYSAIREADIEDISRLKIWGSATDLLARFEKIESWDISLSPIWRL